VLRAVPDILVGPVGLFIAGGVTQRHEFDVRSLTAEVVFCGIMAAIAVFGIARVLSGAKRLLASSTKT
jgi:uncharacterized membrane protein YeaQ/YmgE (transglycosylase-associated protein family)